MSKRGIVWGVIIVIGVIVSYFTVSKGDAVKWNDTVVARHNRIVMALSRFQPQLVDWIQGKTLDVARFDAGLAQYGKEIGQAAGELRRQTPPDEENCKAMHVEMVKYADLQETQLVELRKLCGEMKAANPGKPEDIKRIAAALVVMENKTEAQQGIVNAKQRAMAAKFKLKIK